MASIVEVAKRAQVSVATVSRIMTGSSHPVSSATRSRVLAAAQALNYSPSALAQAMVTRQTHIVAVIVGDAADPYFAAIVRGVEDVARENGYLVVVANSDRVPEIEVAYLRTLNDYRVDGIVFAGGGLNHVEYVEATLAALEAFHQRGAAVVTLGKHLFPALSVHVDNWQIAWDATDYLIRLGHQRIAFISGPPVLLTSELRLNGYRAALQHHGLTQQPALEFDGDFTDEGGLRAAQAIAALPERPTAALASNDLTAIGCLMGLKRAGLCVPEDVSVMGIDDITTTRYVDPPLTTVAIPMQALGATAMEQVLRLRKEGGIGAGDIRLPHALVTRQSTAPPRRSAAT
jgi:LacI family transcriptional regulator